MREKEPKTITMGQLPWRAGATESCKGAGGMGRQLRQTVSPKSREERFRNEWDHQGQGLQEKWGLKSLLESSGRWKSESWGPEISVGSGGTEVSSVDNSHMVLGCKEVVRGTSLTGQWLRLCSQCRGPGFNPWSGNQIPHTATKNATCYQEDQGSWVLQLTTCSAK